jgi:methylated-DNA-[protein]-cysteine S-methyltransferase
MALYSTYFDSPVGILQVSCDEQNIVSIKFMDSPVDMSLNHHPLLDQSVQQLKDYFSGRRMIFEIPYVQPGTDFQRKIWDHLIKIPFGKTLTYKQLTAQFGDMKAIRAVASANGKNDLAILVPCHRVIGSNGSLTGYAGGLWRKKWLLEHEAKFRQGEMF